MSWASPAMAGIAGLLGLCFICEAKAQSDCTYLDALIDVKALEEAKAEIRKIEDHTCLKISAANLAKAVEAQARAIDAAIANAQTLNKAGEFDEALKALKTLPPETLASKRVTEMLELLKIRKAEVAVKQVKKLAELGLYEEALEELEEALKDNPGMALPVDLKYLEGGSIAKWRDAKSWIRNYVVPMLEILVLVIVASLVLGILWRYFVGKPALAFKDFNDKGIQSSPGADVKALMQAAYQELGHGSGGYFTRVSGNLEGIKLPSSAVPKLPTPLQNPLIQFILTLLDRILPRKTYTVMGHLHDSETKGAGLTVIVTSNRGQSDSVTLWESEFSAGGKPRKEKAGGTNVDQSGDFESLANYAAIWLLFRLSKQLLFSGRQSKRLVRALDTDSWRAYSLFQAALAEDRLQNYDAAKILYIDALKADMRLSIAKINLAEIARREAQWLFAEQLWNQCISKNASNLLIIVLRNTVFPYPNEQSRYLAMYKLASLIHQNRNKKSIGIERANERALDESRKLKRAIDYRVCGLRVLDGIVELSTVGIAGDFRGRLRHYLENLRTVNDAMRGGLMIEVGGQMIGKDKKMGENLVEEGGNIVRNLVKERYILPRTQYNLACAFSCWAAVEADRNNTKESDTFLEKSLEHLEKSHWLDRLDKGETEEDRSLEFVRQKCKKKFDEIFQEKPKLPPLSKTDIGRLKSIPEVFVTKLEKENIRTVSEMIFLTKTKEQRKTLGKSIEAGLDVITNWALALEIASLQGVEIEDVNLLLKAKVHTVDDLRNANPTRLTRTLNEYGGIFGWPKTYDKSHVRFWIDSAKNTPNRIKV